MSIKPFVEKGISNAGKIVNLNRQAHENQIYVKSKLLEKAKKLLEKPKVPVELRVYTILNLCLCYSQQGFEFKAIKILTHEIEFLATKPGILWEKALVLISLGNFKSAIDQHQESIQDFILGIKTLEIAEVFRENYYITLSSAYFNCGIAWQHLFKFQKAAKCLVNANKIAIEKLGSGHSLSIFLKKKQEASFYRYLDNSQVKIAGKSLSGKRTPAKIKLKTEKSLENYEQKRRFCKKFKVLSKSSDLSCYKSNLKNINPRYSSILSSLPEDDDELLTKYPFTKASSHFSNSITDVFSRAPPNLNHKPLGSLMKLVPIKPPKNLEIVENVKKIQKNFRIFLARKRRQKKISAAILIQKHVRRYQVKSIYQHIKAAIIFIQSVFRGFKLRKKLKNTD